MWSSDATPASRNCRCSVRDPDESTGIYHQRTSRGDVVVAAQSESTVQSSTLGSRSDVTTYPLMLSGREGSKLDVIES